MATLIKDSTPINFLIEFIFHPDSKMTIHTTMITKLDQK